jgi:hypothetical protein
MSMALESEARPPDLFAVLADRQVASADGTARSTLRPWLPYPFERIPSADVRAGDEPSPFPSPRTSPSSSREQPRPEGSVTSADVSEFITSIVPARHSAQRQLEIDHRDRTQDRGAPAETVALRPSVVPTAAEPLVAPPRPAKVEPIVTPASTQTFVHHHVHSHEHVSPTEPVVASAESISPSARLQTADSQPRYGIRPLRPAPTPSSLRPSAPAFRRLTTPGGYDTNRGERETTVEIHIGRLEVRAHVDPQPRRTAARASERDDRLAAYLQRRAAGARS